MAFDTEALDRAYRVVTVFEDAHRRQEASRQIKEFVARRNKEGWK